MSFDALTFGRLRGLSTMDRMLLLVSIVCSAIYFVTLEWAHLPGRVGVKALSIVPMAILAFKLLRESGMRGKALLRDHDNTVLGMALIFSSIGDVLLDVEQGRLFIRGLLAFLTAHFIYILLFVRSWPRPLRPSGGQLLGVAGVLVYSLMLASWFAPSLA